MIVVDTNVICYRWMPSANSAAADAAWEKDPEWIAPLLWRSEFRNVLAGALRKKLITSRNAVDIAGKAEKEFLRREFLVSSEAILRLVSASSCSAYDCEFVALAEERDIPLVTEDRNVLRDFPSLAISLAAFAQPS